MTFSDICLVIIIVQLVIMLGVFMASGFAGKPSAEGIKATLQNLRRSREDLKLGGVCAGLGKYTPLPAWIWRAAFLGLAFCGGVGVVAYGVLWVCMPAPKE